MSFPDPLTAKSDAWWQRQTPVVVVAGCYAIVAAVLPLISGTFWPIAAAQRVISQHSLHFHDDRISSLSIRGHEWVVQPWLSSLVLRGAWSSGQALHGLAGAATALSVVATVLAVVTGIFLYLLARQRSARPVAAIVALGELLFIMPLTLRTESFAIVCGAALLWALPRRAAWWLVPLLIALWANVHGSFPVGVALALVAAVGMLGDVPVARARLRKRLLWCAACAAAWLLSPLGYGAIAYVQKVSSTTQLAALTSAWRPLPLPGARSLAICIIVVVCGVACLRSRSRSRASAPASNHSRSAGVPLNYRWRELLPVVAFGAASIVTQRYLPWFAIVSAPMLAQVLASWRVLPAELTSRLIAITLLVVVVGGAIVLAPGLPPRQHFVLNGQPTTRELAGIRATDHVFASAEWADLVFLRTGAHVDIDARLERFTGADLRRYQQVIAGDSSPLIPDGYSVALIRRTTGSQLDHELRSHAHAQGWCLVTSTRSASQWRRSVSCANQ